MTRIITIKTLSQNLKSESSLLHSGGKIIFPLLGRYSCFSKVIADIFLTWRCGQNRKTAKTPAFPDDITV